MTPVLKGTGESRSHPWEETVALLLFRGEHALCLHNEMSHTVSHLQPGRALGSRSIPLPEEEEPSDNRRMGPGRLIVSSSSVAPVAGDK